MNSLRGSLPLPLAPATPVRFHHERSARRLPSSVMAGVPGLHGCRRSRGSRKPLHPHETKGWRAAGRPHGPASANRAAWSALENQVLRFRSTHSRQARDGRATRLLSSRCCSNAGFLGSTEFSGDVGHPPGKRGEGCTRAAFATSE